MSKVTKIRGSIERNTPLSIYELRLKQQRIIQIRFIKRENEKQRFEKREKKKTSFDGLSPEERGS